MPRSGARPLLLPLTITALAALWAAECACPRGCDLALGSYSINSAVNLSYIASLFGRVPSDFVNDPYNPHITNKDYIITGDRLNVTFSCNDCIAGAYLGHAFSYQVQKGDTYTSIATNVYANLTSAEQLGAVNSYPATKIPTGATINVTVNCSCGNSSVSEQYGLFETYPLLPGESLASVAAEFNWTSQQDLLQRYNPGVKFSVGKGIVFIPTRDQYGSYRALSSSGGVSGGAIAGIVIAVVVALLLGISLLFLFRRHKKAQKSSLLLSTAEDSSIQLGTSVDIDKIGIDKSVEFSYEELSEATNDFSMDNKIGQGGFGSVYYAELRGEEAAIKKMDMQASYEFLAELRVLTRVHHLNLVRLIGYCVERSFFLVYEYIDNGNLSQHLRGSGREPLSWAARIQIALDAARGLEYIHEHTVLVYIHRDIKSANILIDRNFRAKVADFGLTKLTEVGSTSLPTRVVGTFGYMPPEYARYGDVSPKVDVYAFGVVLYELISARGAIVQTDESSIESKGLAVLFDIALSKPNAKEDARKLIDPRLGDDYPIESVLKMAQLARQCTRDQPQSRPSMRSVVVALMTLSSTSEVWDISPFHENQGLTAIVSGR